MRKGLVFLTVLALQTAPIAYASGDTGSNVKPNEDSVTFNEGGKTEQQENHEQNQGEQDQKNSDALDANESVMGRDIEDADTEDSDTEVSDGEQSGEEKPEEQVPGINGTPGWLLHGEDWYYYDASGVKANGWRLVNGAWYYLDGGNSAKPGVMLKSTKQTIDGAVYFFAESGAMLTGWVLRPEGWYYASGSGAMVTGWLLLGRTWYYLDGGNEEYPGLMLANCSKEIGGAKYFFDGSGAMPTGWVLRPEGWYYTNGSGAMVTGWLLLGSTWYYLNGGNEEYPGLMYANCGQEIDGAKYFFDGNGAMGTGWVLRPEGWYYASGSGAMITGWIRLGGLRYYLDGGNEEYPGLMLVNCEKEIDGKVYTFTGSGAMRAGWFQDEAGAWYYYDENSGDQVSGWKKVGGIWYYLDPENENKMYANGWKVIDGQWYFLQGSGAMATNWLLLGSDWYYLGADGAMKTGWQMVGGRWYYMYTANDPHGGSEGVMAKNTTIDGYPLSSDGALYSEVELMAKNVLDRVGWNLRAAFNYSAGLTYYRMTASPSPGSEWFAKYGFQNGKGNCYVMAATFCYMARLLGYDAHQMAGMVPRRGGGVTPHSWCEVRIGGTTYVFDPNFTNETGRNGYQISYGTSGTWMYSSYSRMN